MSDCQSAREGALDAMITGAPLSVTVQKHLAGCAACRAELVALRGLWQDLGRLPAHTGAIPDAAAVWQRARSTSSEGATGMRKTQLIAALVGGLLLGGLGGYSMRAGGAAQPVSEGSTFLLLLHEDAASDARYTPEQLRGIVGEYRDWAQRLAAQERLVSAEKLRTDSRWLASDGSLLNTRQSDMVSGYFLLRARDYEEALQLARTSPHLKYGGSIEVRAIEDTSTP